MSIRNVRWAPPRPISEAPTDGTRVLAWCWGAWRTARFEADYPSRYPRPYWSVDGWRITDSREHQPEWFYYLPEPLTEKAKSDA